MLEHSHLKIIHALHENGTLTKAANALFLSQSALSHQIRYLEKKLDVTLWEREGRNLRLTQAGEMLLETAQQILPVLAQSEKKLKAFAEGRLGVLRIGVECYPCYEWLIGVIGVFLKQLPEIEIEIINKFQFSGLEGLLNHHIDVLITPDIDNREKVHNEVLAEYDLVMLLSNKHRLANCKSLTPEDLMTETLLTFPVPAFRLDIINRFLNPAKVKPAKIKKIESIDLMLQMVALNRGVTVLPEWLADEYINKLGLKKVSIGKKGFNKKLYISLRENDLNKSYIQKFINLGKQQALKKFNNN